MTRFLPFGSRSKTIQVNTLGGSAPAVTYATWNPADKDAWVVLLNWNLTAESTDYVNWHAVRSTISKSSWKWYWEITQTAGFAGGNITQWVAKSTENLASFVWNWANWYWLFGDTQKINNSSFSAYGTLGRNIIVWDIVQVLLNMDSGNVSFWVNWTTYGIAFSGLSWEFFAIVANAYSTQTANFGATPFAYPVPSGYNAGLYA